MVAKVQDILPIIQYSATAGQTIFPYPFPVFASGDIVVTVDSVTQSEGTDYTVSGVGLENGGDITFLVGRTAGQIVTIYRDQAFDRLVDYQNNGDFLSTTVNDDYDRIWLALQQLKEVDSRSIKFAQEDTGKASTIDTSQTGKLIGLDENGDIFYYSAASDVETDYKTYSDLSSVIADASLVLNDKGRIQGAGDFEIVNSNPGDYFVELASGGLYIKPLDSEIRVELFGGVADGATDNGAFQQNAADYIDSVGGGAILYGNGTYLSNSSLTVSSNTKLKGLGRVSTILNFIGVSGIISPDNNQHVVVEDLQVLGDDTASVYGIDVSNNPRGFRCKNVFIRRFGGNSDTSAGLRLKNNVTFDMWGSVLESVIVESCARGFELNGANNTILSGCISRLNFSHTLYANNCVTLTIEGGAYENTLGTTVVSPVYGMWILGTQNFNISGLWSENIPNNLIRIENSKGGEISSTLFTNPTDASQNHVEVINSDSVDFVGVRVKSLESGDTGVVVDATSTNIDTSGIYFETVLAGSTTKSISDGSRPNLEANQIQFDGGLLTFKQGVWTPVVRGSSTAGTYELATAAGSYIRAGDFIIASCKIVLAGAITGGGTGFLSVVLPEPYAAGNEGLSASVRIEGFSFTGSYVSTERATSSEDTRLILTGIDNAGVNTFIPISAIGINDEIDISVTYKAA